MKLEAMESIIRNNKLKIESCLDGTPWDFGNNVLYGLCLNNPDHKKEDIVIAKVWLIGRSYSAAIERRNNAKPNEKNDCFYIKKVAPKLINSELDSKIKELETAKEIKEENIDSILDLHKCLLKLFEDITQLNKRSLCSKYLHFHLPKLFFIYDSRSTHGLTHFISRVPNELNNISKSKEVDEEYRKFFLKSFYVREEIKKYLNIQMTPREFDNLLIYEDLNKSDKINDIARDASYEEAETELFEAIEKRYSELENDLSISRKKS